MGEKKQFPLPGRLFTVFGKLLFHRVEHQCERCSKFVAYIRKEGRLCAINLGQRFGPPSFRLVCSRIAKRCRNLAGKQFDETSVRRIVAPIGIGADDKKTGGCSCP